jgi:hypothetical protein
MVLLFIVLVGCSRESDGLDVATGSPSGASAVQSEDTAPAPSEPGTPDETQETEPTPSSSVASPSSKPTQQKGGEDEGGENTSSSSPTPSPSSMATPKPSKEPDTAAPAVDSITLSIEGNSEWGTILASESIVLGKEDTATEVLKRTAKKHKLAYEIRGSGALTYVEGIDGLYEFDDGPTSGWKFRVNGIVPDIGAGSYKLEPGDRLEWFYTSEDEAAEQDKESAS